MRNMNAWESRVDREVMDNLDDYNIDKYTKPTTDPAAEPAEEQPEPRIELMNRIAELVKSINVPPFHMYVHTHATPKRSVVSVLVGDEGTKDHLTIGITEELRVTFDGWKRGWRLKEVVRAIQGIHENVEDPFDGAPLMDHVKAGQVSYAEKLAKLGPEGAARSMALMREARWKPYHDAIETVIEQAEVLSFAKELIEELELAGIQPHQQKAALKRICDVIINYRKA